MKFSKTAFATGIALSLAAMSAPASATVSQEVTDARQETQIWTTYVLSPYLRASDLKVEVHSGKAILSGTVEDPVNKDLAKQIALGVNGIKDVDNQIQVQADYIPVRHTDRSFGDVVDDASITAAVKSKLLWSKKADGLTTDVDTKDGRVTLIGNADSASERNTATRLASNTRGVMSVDNQMVVKTSKASSAKAEAKAEASEARQDVSDTWITAKVKSTYMYSSNVDGGDITVSTKGGIVTLSGKVDSGAERALAIEFARNVRGVKSVSSKALTL
jgi:osmotically-inducible protein OsmY